MEPLKYRLFGAALAASVTLGLAFGPGTATAAEAQTQEIYRFPLDGGYNGGLGGPSGLVRQRTPGGPAAYALYGSLWSPAGQSYVFKLVPPPRGVSRGAWTETILYRTTGEDQKTIRFSVALDGAGALYGIQYYLATATIFKLLPPTATHPDWQFTTLPAEPDLRPAAALTLDAFGGVYGTSYYTANTCGLVFKLTPPLTPSGSYTYQVLHNFPYGSDGNCDSGFPQNRLVIDRIGNVYGRASAVLFKLSPPRGGSSDWAYQVVYTYGTSEQSGQFPLAIDPAGNLYASALTSSQSAIFALTAPTAGHSTWIRKDIGVLPFDAQDPREKSEALSLMYLDGDLVVTTLNSVFELTPPASGSGLWTTRTLSTFATNLTTALDAPFAVDAAGNLYGGVDCSGCEHSFGSAYKIYRTPPAAAR